MICSWLPNLKKKVPFCFHSYVKVLIQTWSSVLPSLVILNSNLFLSLIHPVESPSHLRGCRPFALLPQSTNAPWGQVSPDVKFTFFSWSWCLLHNSLCLCSLILSHRMLFNNLTSFLSFSQWKDWHKWQILPSPRVEPHSLDLLAQYHFKVLAWAHGNYCK